MHRDPEDGLLYITKIVKIDSNNNIIGIRKMLNSNGKELGKVLHNDPIMIRDIEEMTTKYKNEMVSLAKKTLKPSVYEDTRHIIDNLRVIPEPGGSLSVSNYASKRKFSAVSSENILRMEGANSCVYSGGDIVGRISDNTGISEGHASIVSRLHIDLHATNTSTTMGQRSAHTSVNEIFQVFFCG